MTVPALDELLDRAVDSGALPGVVAVVTGPDELRYEHAAGRLSVEGDAPATPDTVFRIASMTKAFTSVAALQLLEQGRLELDAPVTEHLPELGNLQVLEGFDGDTPRLRAPAGPVTLRHLMTHTSGFAYWFGHTDLLRWYEVTGTPGLLTGQRAALRTPLVHDPGERWTYGIGTDWLGLLVEEVAGQTLDAYLAEHVFGPLGMTDSGFAPTHGQRSRLMAVHARQPDGGLALSDAAIPEEAEFASGGAGAYGTAGDYARFLRALLRGGELDGERILGEDTARLLFVDHLQGAPLPELMESAVPELTNPVPALPFAQGWGLGLHLLEEDVPGMRRSGSADWAGLFNCYFWIDRASGLAAAFMTQVLPFFDQRVLEEIGISHV